MTAHMNTSEPHEPGCEGCQILGLMAERGALRAAIAEAPHAPGCSTFTSWPTAAQILDGIDHEVCDCWKSRVVQAESPTS